MDDKRSNVDRRSKNDRRKGGVSPSNGPERRGIKYQRSDTDRRQKKNEQDQK